MSGHWVGFGDPRGMRSLSHRSSGTKLVWKTKELMGTWNDTHDCSEVNRGAKDVL